MYGGTYFIDDVEDYRENVLKIAVEEVVQMCLIHAINFISTEIHVAGIV